MNTDRGFQCIALSMVMMLTDGWAAEPEFKPSVARREPVALAVDGDTLLAANRGSGSLSIVDRPSRRVIGELQLGAPLAGIVAGPASHGCLAIGRRGQLWQATRNGARPIGRLLVSEIDQCALSPSSGHDRVLAAASTWERAIVLAPVALAAEFIVQPTLQRKVPLTFSPKHMVWLPGCQKLLAADAFGGALALIDAQTAAVERQWNMPWRHVGGMAIKTTPKAVELLLTCQRLDRGWADRDGVHWGIFLSNQLRGLPLAMLLRGASEQELLDGSWSETLGLVGDAAGDPGIVRVDDDQTTCVALHGIDEVLVAGSSYRKQLPVKDGPAAFCRVGDELWVSCALDDSLSLIDLRHGRQVADVSLGPAPPLTSAERGRRLFLDASLSHDGWMSCNSCHVDGHTSGGFADTLGDGGYGNPKRIPSLLGVGDTGPWAWNGSVESLQTQIKKSVRTTMHGRISDRQAEDLEAYLRSLPPAPAASDVDEELARRGARVFRREGCAACHQAPNYTSRDAYNVGVVDESGNSAFNPPSLRGVGRRPQLFHDGRHQLDPMIRQGKHQLTKPLSTSDANALVAFLRSL